MRRCKSLLSGFVVATGLMIMASTTVFADSSLSELTVKYETDNGESETLSLSPEFSSDVTEYTATVKNSVSKLDVDAVAAEESAKVDVQWEALDVGDNKTYIDVTDSTGDKTRYTISTKRLTTEEEETYTEEKDEDSGVTVKVNKIQMTVASSIDKKDIPEGFEESTYTYKKKEFPCIVGKTKQLTALYLINKEQGIEGFYIYNEEKDSFYAMKNILIKSRMYTIVNPETKDSCLKNYTKKKITIIDQEVNAWELDSEEKLYLVYAMNWDGDINLYCYDDNEKCFQRYIATSDVNTQLEAANTSYSKLQDKYNTIVDRYNILVKIIAGLVILIVILIFVVLNLILSNKAKKIKEDSGDIKDSDKHAFGMDVEGVMGKETDDSLEGDILIEEDEQESDETVTTKTQEEEIEEAISEVNEDLKLAVAMETGMFDEVQQTEEIKEKAESQNLKEAEDENEEDDDDDFIFID